MKYLRNLSLISLMFAPLIGFAKPVFQIAASSSSLTLTSNQTSTATFTVTNVSGVNFPSQVGYTPNINSTNLFTSAVSSNSTCGTSLANGASCQLVINVTSKNATGTASLTPKVCYFEHTCSIGGSGGTTTVSINPSATYPLTAAGTNLSNTSPLLAESINNGISWYVPTITGLPASGEFSGTGCSGTGSSAVCTAAGINSSLSPQPPLLAVSSNGGVTWSVATIPSLPTYGYFAGSSCTGSGSTAFCIAVGANSATAAPLLVESTNGGNTWSIASVTGIPSAGEYTASGCTGSGSNAICIAVGENSSTGAPLIVTSTNDGTSWAAQSISGLPASGFFSSASCVGSGSSAICSAAGTNASTGHPLLTVSTNGESTWTVETLSGSLPLGQFNSTSCTGLGANAICIAAGQNAESIYPLLVESTNGGSTWGFVTIPSLTDQGTYNGSGCTGEGATAICIAAGQDSTTNAPLLVESTNGGSTWSVQSISGLPALGVFYGASCTGTGATAVCIAAGEDLVNDTALLVTSLDGGATWRVQSFTGAPSTGVFNATGASSTAS